MGPSPNEAEQAEVISKKSTKEKKASEKETKQDSERDKFMKVMKPRTKKGPSWANEDSQAPGTAGKVVIAEEDVPNKSISDLDWFKKHTSKNVDNVDKVFEQSDDEAEKVCSFRFN
jgi:multiple RNA-binding domain-containing protein 1